MNGEGGRPAGGPPVTPLASVPSAHRTARPTDCRLPLLREGFSSWMTLRAHLGFSLQELETAARLTHYVCSRRPWQEGKRLRRDRRRCPQPTGQGARGPGGPKSQKSKRLVVLDTRTARALAAHRQRQELEKQAMGDRYHDEGRVFANLEGRAPYRSNLYEHFREQVKAAGLPRIRLHDLRHTHDTHLKQAGVHPRDQQDRLGHATLAMAEKYTHVLTPDQIETVRRWEAFMYGTKPVPKEKRPKTRTRAERGGGASW